MTPLLFKYQNRITEVVIEKGYLKKPFKKIIKYSKWVIVTDKNLASLYCHLWADCKTIIVPEGELAKTINVYYYVCNELANFSIDKDTAIIAFGGGSICDLTGFIASTYKRGLPLIYIPTTLLAQVDASLGGKNAINLNKVKNAIGTFYQPNQVIIDQEILSTLSQREFNNGMAELIKYALLFDEAMFLDIENQNYRLDDLIAKAVLYKNEITTKDEFDQYDRCVLNFGHTFGHILEQLTNFDLKHGEAVAWGILYEIKNIPLRERVKTVFNHFNLLKPHNFAIKDLTQYLKQDKKNYHNHLLMVELTAIGKYQLKRKSIEEITLEVNDEHFW